MDGAATARSGASLKSLMFSAAALFVFFVLAWYSSEPHLGRISEEPGTPLHNNHNNEDLTSNAPSRSQPSERTASGGQATNLSLPRPIRPTAERELNAAVAAAAAKCNADTHNNAGHSVSCFFCRNAIVTPQEIYCDRVGSPEAVSALVGTRLGPIPFPNVKGGRGTRHHLKPISISFDPPPLEVSRALVQGSTPVGYYQSPVSGAQYLNVWHTLADFGSMMFHTLESLLSPLQGETEATKAGARAHSRIGVGGGPVVTWVSRSPRMQMGRGCADEAACRQLPLFELLHRMLGGGDVRVLSPSSAPIHFPLLLVGLNTQCSPIPTEGVGVPECRRNLFALRQRLLAAYNISSAPVDAEGLRCPTVHVMSRQSDQYRRIKPFDAMMAALRAFLAAKANCSPSHVQVVSLSSSVPMAEQIRSVANSTVLVAGRGGGTTLSMFLPHGGGYLSISGFDRWNPFRDLVPEWITLQHYEARLTHHANFDLPPAKFGTGKSQYIDPNRAAYLVDPAKVAEAFGALLEKMAAANRTTRLGR